jgi:predicted esterase
MAASLMEALRQGAKGAAYDGVLLGRPWGFKLEAIAIPKLYLWHGEHDDQVPLAMGRALAAQLVQCTATYYPGEGHISVIVNHREEIVRSLIS